MEYNLCIFKWYIHEKFGLICYQSCEEVSCASYVLLFASANHNNLIAQYASANQCFTFFLTEEVFHNCVAIMLFILFINLMSMICLIYDLIYPDSMHSQCIYNANIL